MKRWPSPVRSPTIDFDVEDAIDIPVYNPVKEAAPYKAPRVQVNSGYNPFETSSYKKPEFDWSKLYNDFEGDRNAIRQGAELTGSFLAPDISEPTIEADEVAVQDTSGPVCSTMCPTLVISIKENIS